MPIAERPFGVYEGADARAFTLRNADGYAATLSDFGARLVALEAPDRSGRSADIVLGFGDVAGYAASGFYVGATCGRYANRIREGRFPLDGREVHLARNENGNHLHGGPRGFDQAIWSATVDAERNAVTFAHVSPDGDQGYPGTLRATVDYALTDANELRIAMTATCDAPTVVNLVNHAYWNCAGHDAGTILDQHLQVEADFYTPVDRELLTTGEIRTVAGTPLDFRTAKPVGRDLAALDRAGLGGSGYDHNWVVRGRPGQLRPVATLWDPASGRGFDLAATEPGVQIYTAGSMASPLPGKTGTPYPPYAGIALETQKFPDSPNVGHFPSSRLVPGEAYDHRMVYRFFVR